MTAADGKLPLWTFLELVAGGMGMPQSCPEFRKRATPLNPCMSSPGEACAFGQGQGRAVPGKELSFELPTPPAGMGFSVLRGRTLDGALQHLPQ